MLIEQMNWQQVEAYLKQDDRAVVPLGSTEQHAYLSLSTDNILAGKMAQDSAETLNVPVFPVLNYGITPKFTSYPGTLSLRISTYLAVIRDLLDGLAHSGFRRILFVNGHGGNIPATTLITEWLSDNPDMQVKFHNWWAAPAVAAKVDEIDPVASHASWMENFPWTRLADVALPEEQKELVDYGRLAPLNAPQARRLLGDGNYGGYYQRSDAEMLALWQIGVAETRAQITDGWQS